MERLGFTFLGLVIGIGATIWIQSRPVFNPFAFRLIEHEHHEFFLQQRIDLPFPMADHLTEVWYKDKSLPKHSSTWRNIGKVLTDPFDLSEVQVIESKPELIMKFPWGATLASKDRIHWQSKYAR